MRYLTIFFLLTLIIQPMTSLANSETPTSATETTSPPTENTEEEEEEEPECDQFTHHNFGVDANLVNLPHNAGKTTKYKDQFDEESRVMENFTTNKIKKME